MSGLLNFGREGAGVGLAHEAFHKRVLELPVVQASAHPDVAGETSRCAFTGRSVRVPAEA